MARLGVVTWRGKEPIAVDRDRDIGWARWSGAGLSVAMAGPVSSRPPVRDYSFKIRLALPLNSLT